MCLVFVLKTPRAKVGLWFQISQCVTVWLLREQARTLQSQGMVWYRGHGNKLHDKLHVLSFNETEFYGNRYFNRYFTLSQSIKTQEQYEIICENSFQLPLLNHCQYELDALRHYWRIEASKKKEIIKSQSLLNLCLEKTLWRSLGKTNNKRRKKTLKLTSWLLWSLFCRKINC